MVRQNCRSCTLTATAKAESRDQKREKPQPEQKFTKFTRPTSRNPQTQLNIRKLFEDDDKIGEGTASTSLSHHQAWGSPQQIGEGTASTSLSHHQAWGSPQTFIPHSMFSIAETLAMEESPRSPRHKERVKSGTEGTGDPASSPLKSSRGASRGRASPDVAHKQRQDLEKATTPALRTRAQAREVYQAEIASAAAAAGIATGGWQFNNMPPTPHRHKLDMDRMRSLQATSARAQLETPAPAEAQQQQQQGAASPPQEQQQQHQQQQQDQQQQQQSRSGRRSGKQSASHSQSQLASRDSRRTPATFTPIRMDYVAKRVEQHKAGVREKSPKLRHTGGRQRSSNMIGGSTLAEWERMIQQNSLHMVSQIDDVTKVYKLPPSQSQSPFNSQHLFSSQATPSLTSTVDSYTNRRTDILYDEDIFPGVLEALARSREIAAISIIRQNPRPQAWSGAEDLVDGGRSGRGRRHSSSSEASEGSAVGAAEQLPPGENGEDESGDDHFEFNPSLQPASTSGTFGSAPDLPPHRQLASNQYHSLNMPDSAMPGGVGQLAPNQYHSLNVRDSAMPGGVGTGAQGKQVGRHANASRFQSFGNGQQAPGEVSDYDDIPTIEVLAPVSDATEPDPEPRHLQSHFASESAPGPGQALMGEAHPLGSPGRGAADEGVVPQGGEDLLFGQGPPAEGGEPASANTSELTNAVEELLKDINLQSRPPISPHSLSMPEGLGGATQGRSQGQPPAPPKAISRLSRGTSAHSANASPTHSPSHSAYPTFSASYNESFLADLASGQISEPIPRPNRDASHSEPLDGAKPPHLSESGIPNLGGGSGGASPKRQGSSSPRTEGRASPTGPPSPTHFHGSSAPSPSSLSREGDQPGPSQDPPTVQPSKLSLDFSFSASLAMEEDSSLLDAAPLGPAPVDLAAMRSSRSSSSSGAGGPKDQYRISLPPLRGALPMPVLGPEISASIQLPVQSSGIGYTVVTSVNQWNPNDTQAEDQRRTQQIAEVEEMLEGERSSLQEDKVKAAARASKALNKMAPADYFDSSPAPSAMKLAPMRRRAQASSSGVEPKRDTSPEQLPQARRNGMLPPPTEKSPKRGTNTTQAKDKQAAQQQTLLPPVFKHMEAATESGKAADMQDIWL